MKIPITLIMGDITYNDIDYTLLTTINKTHKCNFSFNNGISKVIKSKFSISFVVVYILM